MRFSGILAPKQYFVGTELAETVYHVLLGSRTVGPFDRRTIVGMRIKKTLTSDHVLIGTDGTQLTVRDLIGRRPAPHFQPERSGGYSVVQATLAASLLEVDGPGMWIPKFKGEVQARVQTEVLRIAGRFRRRLRWKEDRVKLPLKDIVHAGLKGSQVELWLRNAGQDRLQRIALELFTAESACEQVDCLPRATPYPEATSTAAGSVLTPAALPIRRGGASAASNGLWIAVVAASVVLALMVAVLVLRRVY